LEVLGAAPRPVKPLKVKSGPKPREIPFRRNCYIAFFPELGQSRGKPMKFNMQDLMFFLPMIAIIYFMIFLPKRKEQQAFNKLISSLKKGDKVMTNSSMYGEVAAIKDDLVTLKFHDGVKIDFHKSAISKAVEDKVEAKA
jgi:preprotein translocase YajC subunit